MSLGVFGAQTKYRVHSKGWDLSLRFITSGTGLAALIAASARTKIPERYLILGMDRMSKDDFV
jgi:hypothetical protein